MILKFKLLELICFHKLTMLTSGRALPGPAGPLNVAGPLPRAPKSRRVPGHFPPAPTPLGGPACSAHAMQFKWSAILVI